VLKQGQYLPMPVEKQVIQIYAATNKDETGVTWIRNIPVEQVARYMKELIEFLDARHPDVAKSVAEKKALDDGIKGSINKALTEFRGLFKVQE
jgi:F-type H+-transporting ATPase subunit alpha